MQVTHVSPQCSPKLHGMKSPAYAYAHAAPFVSACAHSLRHVQQTGLYHSKLGKEHSTFSARHGKLPCPRHYTCPPSQPLPAACRAIRDGSLKPVWHQSRRGFICIGSGMRRRCSADSGCGPFMQPISFHRQDVQLHTVPFHTLRVKRGRRARRRLFTPPAALLCQSPSFGDLRWKGLQPSVRLDPEVLGMSTVALPAGGHPVRLACISSQAGTSAL